MEEPELFDSFVLADEVISKLLSNIRSYIFDKDLQQKALKFAIANSIEILITVTEVNFLRKDYENEHPDLELPEPYHGGLETWMRSAIPVHKRFIQKPFIQDPPNLIENKTVVSFKSSFYRSNTLQKISKKPSKIAEAPRAEPMSQEVQTISDSEEFIRLKKERDFKRKQEETARIEALKKEDESKRKLLARQLNGKIKNFTYDFHGKVILVNPASLANEVVDSVGFRVAEDEIIEEKPKSLPRTGQGVRVLEKKTLPRTGQGVRVLEKKKILDPIIEKPLKHIYSASVLEHLRLAPGVNFGGTLKKPANSSRNLNPASKKTPKKVELVPIVSKEPEIKLKKQGVYESISETVPDLQITTEKMGFVKENKKKKDEIKHYSRNIPKLDDLTDYEKFNFAILSDANWGKNPSSRTIHVPARVPKTATAKDQWEIYGFLGKKPKDEPFMSTDELIQLTSSKKKPRDRPFIEKGEKKKQPAPPLGQTMKLDR